jgi:hypothetical protein
LIAACVAGSIPPPGDGDGRGCGGGAIPPPGGGIIGCGGLGGPCGCGGGAPTAGGCGDIGLGVLDSSPTAGTLLCIACLNSS